MGEEIPAENKGVTIPAEVRWLSNSRIRRERMQRGEMKVSSVVIIVRWKKVASRLLNKGGMTAEVGCEVE
jgi:hypothetical protein